MQIVEVAEATSTNSLMANELADSPHATVLRAVGQTAGRGQRGNSWEAEPGKNLTFSVLLRPDGVEARCQFALSEAVAVAVAEVVERRLRSFAPQVEVKWPNDIYVGSRKVCGILIENSLSGSHIERSIAGVGINVNQTAFLSDAPNPVSMAIIAGHEFELRELLAEVAGAIVGRVGEASTEAGREGLHRAFLSRLWRREGFHPFSTPDGSLFHARIVDVAPDGILSLGHRDGSLSMHAFKEVAFVL